MKRASMKILFLHGWRSKVGGVKPSFLQQHGHTVLNPALDDDDFAAAVATAQHAFDTHQPDVVAGSSRGGAVALNINSGDTPLVLLCPAWKNWGTASALKPQAVVLHSRDDDIIPFADSQELIRSNSLPPETLIETGSDHRLADPAPLADMLAACERLHNRRGSMLDDPAISGHYLFPQARQVADPFMVAVDGIQLACYRKVVDPGAYTLAHFHGNGEAVADYIPQLSGALAESGLNSLFVEYREYGGSTGKAQLQSMLGDGQAVLAAAGIEPQRAIALGRSIGSLYAIELAHRLPSLAGLIIESGIADPAERFLAHANLSATGFDEQEVRAQVAANFNHQQKLAGYHGALLVLHTADDGLIDISHAERNFAWAGARQKKFIRFPHGNHNTILGVNWSQYLRAIGDFVEAIGSA